MPFDSTILLLGRCADAFVVGWLCLIGIQRWRMHMSPNSQPFISTEFSGWLWNVWSFALGVAVCNVIRRDWIAGILDASHDNSFVIFVAVGISLVLIFGGLIYWVSVLWSGFPLPKVGDAGYTRYIAIWRIWWFSVGFVICNQLWIHWTDRIIATYQPLLSRP